MGPTVIPRTGVVRSQGEADAMRDAVSKVTTAKIARQNRVVLNECYR